VLGTGMETHNSLVTFYLLVFFYFASFLYSLKPYFFSLFFKTFLFYSLNSRSLDLHCPMFPLISSISTKVLVLRLRDTQEQLLPETSMLANFASIQQPATAGSAASAAALSQPTHPPSGSLLYTVANKELEHSSWGRGMIL
jgi:hypothetical protein